MSKDVRNHTALFSHILLHPNPSGIIYVLQFDSLGSNAYSIYSCIGYSYQVPENSIQIYHV